MFFFWSCENHHATDISEDGSHPSHLAEEMDQLHQQNMELWQLLDTVRQENSQVSPPLNQFVTDFFQNLFALLCTSFPCQIFS